MGKHTKIVMKVDDPVVIRGDIKIEFFHKKKENKLFHFWINTFFHNGTKFSIEKEEIDKINKDKKHKVTDKDFTIDIHFSGEYERDDKSIPRIDITEKPDVAAAKAAGEEVPDEPKTASTSNNDKAVDEASKGVASLITTKSQEDILKTPVPADDASDSNNNEANNASGGTPEDLSDNEGDQDEWNDETSI